MYPNRCSASGNVSSAACRTENGDTTPCCETKRLVSRDAIDGLVHDDCA
jgi:hypothetical protein